MKPKFDDRIHRPGGKVYDMSAPTDLKTKFAIIRKQQARNAAETAKVVTPIKRRKA